MTKQREFGNTNLRHFRRQLTKKPCINSKNLPYLQDIRLPPRCSWVLRSSGMLHHIRSKKNEVFSSLDPTYFWTSTYNRLDSISPESSFFRRCFSTPFAVSLKYFRQASCSSRAVATPVCWVSQLLAGWSSAVRLSAGVSLVTFFGASGRAVGWGNGPLDRRSTVRFPMESLEFFIWTNSSARISIPVIHSASTRNEYWRFSLGVRTVVA